MQVLKMLLVLCGLVLCFACGDESIAEEPLLADYQSPGPSGSNLWTHEASGPALSLGSPGSWDDTHIVSPAVIRHKGQFVMYYIGSTGNVDTRRYSLGRATSTDGIKFTRDPPHPVLPAYQGLSVLTPGALRNPDGSLLIEDGQLRLWIVLQDLTNPNSVGTLHSISSNDGINWSIPSPAQLNNIYAPTIIKDESGYALWYIGPPPEQENMPLNRKGTSWVVRYAKSIDGMNWNIHPDPVLRVSQTWENVYLGPPLSQRVFYPYVLKSQGQFIMWYAAYRVGNHIPSTSIGVATSPDGIQWTKSPENPVLTPEPKHFWEAYYTSSHSILRLDDGAWRIFYASRTLPPHVNKYFAISTASTGKIP